MCHETLVIAKEKDASTEIVIDKLLTRRNVLVGETEFVFFAWRTNKTHVSLERLHFLDQDSW